MKLCFNGRNALRLIPQAFITTGIQQVRVGTQRCASCHHFNVLSNLKRRFLALPSQATVPLLRILSWSAGTYYRVRLPAAPSAPCFSVPFRMKSMYTWGTYHDDLVKLVVEVSARRAIFVSGEWEAQATKNEGITHASSRALDRPILQVAIASPYSVGWAIWARFSLVVRRR